MLHVSLLPSVLIVEIEEQQKNAVDRFLLYRKWMRWAGLCTFRTFLEQQQYTYKKKVQFKTHRD